MTRIGQTDGWDMEVHGVDGKVLNHCKVVGSKSVCDVARVPDRP